MLHIILATLLGWGSEQKVIPFDADLYSKDDALSQFTPYQGTNYDGYPYTGYEYNGQKYYNVKYIGKIENRFAPTKKREVDYCISKGLFH